MSVALVASSSVWQRQDAMKSWLGSASPGASVSSQTTSPDKRRILDFKVKMKKSVAAPPPLLPLRGERGHRLIALICSTNPVDILFKHQPSQDDETHLKNIYIVDVDLKSGHALARIYNILK